MAIPAESAAGMVSSIQPKADRLLCDSDSYKWLQYMLWLSLKALCHPAQQVTQLGSWARSHCQQHQVPLSVHNTSCCKACMQLWMCDGRCGAGAGRLADSPALSGPKSHVVEDSMFQDPVPPTVHCNILRAGSKFMREHVCTAGCWSLLLPC